MRQRLSRSTGPSVLLTLLIILTVMFGGCSGIEKAKPRPQSARTDRSIDLDVPRAMRGTIASETIMLGYQPVIVRGYGLVVGLNGSGSREIPPALRAHMLAEMARHGIGQESAGLGHLNPERMLDSLDTAVVIVEGVIPPGSVGKVTRRGAQMPGTSFDVRVVADPRGGTTSLEGGRLYTTELRPALAGETLPPVGSRQAAPLATAGGPIFVNPFAGPEEAGRETIDRTVGRILNGGEVIEDMTLKLRLATPSHARAEIIQNALNTRFPREPGQADETARGESDETIAITIPPSYRSSPDDFVELLRHTTIRQANAEAIASSIRTVVVNDPSFYMTAAWRWEALGRRALPIIRDLYDHPAELPRLAALRAGARIGDPLVTPYLVSMAQSASVESRRQAVALLTDMDLDPRVDQGLRSLLSDDDVEVRLAAYEGLIKRADPSITRYRVDEKFVLDVVPSETPMIYITQIGEPRIAVFGEDLRIQQPMLVNTWSGRLMMQADGDDEQIEVYYRPEYGSERLIEHAYPNLDAFVQFLGHETTIEAPEPGLGLTYSETIGALYAIVQDGYIAADFKSQQDRVLAAIIRQGQETEIERRPEFADGPVETKEPGWVDGPKSGSSDLERLAPPPSIGRAETSR
jgi:flagellar basal body P-ring protein FlgI